MNTREEVYTGWIPNTLGKISFTTKRIPGAFHSESEDSPRSTIIIGKDRFSSDALMPTPILFKPLISLINFILQLFQYFYLLFTEDKFEVEPNLMEIGLFRWYQQSILNRSSDSRFIFIANSNCHEVNGQSFNRNIYGRVFIIPLSTYGPFRKVPDKIKNLNLDFFLHKQSKNKNKNAKDDFRSLLNSRGVDYISCDINIHRSGLCDLTGLSFSRENPYLSCNTENKLSIGRIYQQSFYFIKDCFHQHKHHSDFYDTLTSAYKKNTIEVKNNLVMSSWIKKISYGLFRHAIAQKNRGEITKAKGTAYYIKSFFCAIENALKYGYPKFRVSKMYDPLQVSIVHELHGEIDNFIDSLSNLEKESDTHRQKRYSKIAFYVGLIGFSLAMIKILPSKVDSLRNKIVESISCLFDYSYNIIQADSSWLTYTNTGLFLLIFYSVIQYLFSDRHLKKESSFYSSLSSTRGWMNLVHLTNGYDVFPRAFYLFYSILFSWVLCLSFLIEGVLLCLWKIVIIGGCNISYIYNHPVHPKNQITFNRYSMPISCFLFENLFFSPLLSPLISNNRN